MENKKLYWLFGGLAVLGGLYLWSKKNKSQSPVLTEEEINAMNERVAANDAERKKILDDLYVAYANNWKGSSDVANNYEIGNKQYKCALSDFQNMSNDELKKALEYWTKGNSVWEGNPLQYKVYADLSERYPLAFDDHPCSQNQKPLIIK